MDYEKYINEIITILIHEDGSDLHLGANRKPAIRVNGQLIFIVNQKELTQEDMLGILKMLLGEEKTDKFLKEKEVDFSYTFKEGTYLRCNAFFQRGYICLALRLIPKIKTLKELNLPIILETFTRKNKDFSLSLVR